MCVVKPKHNTDTHTLSLRSTNCSELSPGQNQVFPETDAL